MTNRIQTDGIWFKDEHGRTLILRGANLGGSTKVPFSPDGASYRKEGFYNHREVSFVGRPFPLDQADEHLQRLRAWGLTFLRFLITWEAIEHAGPGQYDEAYLDYVYEVLKKANSYGINVFIDPHQDVWSRWTGGDGAPGWTLEAVGFDLTKLAATGAAISHQEYGDPFPRMIWPTNYSRLATATMFTLFFAGNDFAPATKIDDVPVQDYLQGHYINAVKQLAERVRDLPNVTGYDSLNEPGSGYIGIPDLNEHGGFMLRQGASPTPFQGMLAGAGYPQEIEVYEFGMGGMQSTGKMMLNPKKLSVWRDGYDCVWKANGIWADEEGTPKLLRPDHFAQTPSGKPADFANDYLKPFILRYTSAIREVTPDTMIFLEGAPGGAHPDWSPDDSTNMVNGGHWYDVMTLFTKTFNPEFSVDLATMQAVNGRDEVRQLFAKQLAHVKDVSTEQMNGIPTLIGEFGVPYDLDDKAAYQSGDFSVQTQALDAYYAGMDSNLLSCTIWNYTADNTNARGDLWNDEDLSIFSEDQRDEPDNIHSGGRGLEAVVRPYASKTVGEPLKMTFDLPSRTFEFSFRHQPGIDAPTEIFLPALHYPKGYNVTVSDGTFQSDPETFTLKYQHTSGQETHTITITPAE